MSTVDRLTIEAGKYHGLSAGETIPRSEVIAQAKSNGYTTREAEAMLDDKGPTIEIPQQGNLFGEMWARNETDAVDCLRGMADILDSTDVTIEIPEPGNQSDGLITQPLNTVGKFTQWIDKKRKQNVVPYDDADGKKAPRWLNPEHNWSHEQARTNFARAKDVDRHFWRSYDEFTTVHVVRTADDNTEPLLEQTQALTPRAYYQSRYGLLNRLSDEYAAVEVRAPKYPTHAEKRVRTHIHEGYWLPGHVEPEAFDLLRDRETDVHLSVEHHSTDSYPPVEHGIDADRGATTALPYELAGRNQPLMNVHRDAGDLHDERALEWCATLSAGIDGTHETPGMSYWTELGRFAECAEEIAESREKSEHSITQPENRVGTQFIEAIAKLSQVPTHA